MSELCASDWRIVRQMVLDFMGDMEAVGMPENYKLHAYLIDIEGKLQKAIAAEQEAKDLDELLNNS